MRRFPLIFVLTLFAMMALALPVTAQEEEAPASRFDGESRFTVLILGMDRRPGARENFNTRTDSLVLASFNPADNSIGLLHIPRDLHFAGLDVDPLLRVNTLMIRGENFQEGYGPYYAMDTIQYNLGLYIDAYIAFDFEAFIGVIDALGGVEISTNYNISDPTYPDMNYGIDPFYLPAGDHVLDGRTALKFARTRHGDNDYLRGERQMQLIESLGLKVTDTENLPMMIAQAPLILDDLEGHLYTDLTVEDGIPLALFAATVPIENIRTGSINQAYLTYTVQEGQSIAIPDRTRIIELMAEIFGDDYAG